MTFEQKRDKAAIECCKDWPEQVYHRHDLGGFFEGGADWAKRELGWQPIESAPKDKRILIRTEQSDKRNSWVHEVQWEDDVHGIGWASMLDGNFVRNPTHYMPIPALPNEEKS